MEVCVEGAAPKEGIAGDAPKDGGACVGVFPNPKPGLGALKNVNVNGKYDFHDF